MSVYKIRFYLGSPLLYSVNKPIRPIQGDGIYGYAWALKNGLKKTGAEQNPVNIISPKLPFEKKDGCYTISAGFAAEDAFFEGTKLMRRIESKVYGKHKVGASQLNTQSGEHQAIMDFYWKLYTPYIDFYAKGDLEGILELTNIIQENGYLSAKKTIGFGEIISVKISKVESDWSQWKDGKPTRFIPAGNIINNLATEYCGYKPPYWHVAFWKECYVPPADMHYPVLPKINQESKYNLRCRFYSFMAQESAKFFKKKYFYMPYLKNIVPDMNLKEKVSRKFGLIVKKKDNDFLSLSREFIYFLVYLSIEKWEKDRDLDFETLLSEGEIKLNAIIEKYLSIEQSDLSIEEYLKENLLI